MTRLAIALLGMLPALAAADDHAAWERALARHPLAEADGQVMHLQELRGEVVVVSFWASWCKPCKKELRELDGWVEADGSEGPRIVAVSVDADTKKAIRFVEEAAVRIPVYHDGPAGLAKTLDLPALPMTLVLDREGRIAHVARGGSAEEMASLRGTVRRLLDEPLAPRVPAVPMDEEVGG
jgi:peroxiredoxin